MLYLAQVIKRSFRNRIGLKLLAVQQANRLWAKTDIQVVDAEDIPTLSDCDLAVVDLASNHKILKVLDAAVELPIILEGLSKRLTSAESENEQREEEWELRRSSLEYQSSELNKRKEDLDSREEQLKLQELQVTQTLTRAKDWEAKLRQVRATLQTEWETLRKKEAKLDTRSLAE